MRRIRIKREQKVLVINVKVGKIKEEDGDEGGVEKTDEAASIHYGRNFVVDLIKFPLL